MKARALEISTKKCINSSGDTGVSSGKPAILAFVGNYLPGYKAGGILRTVVNTVDHLCDEFEFRIVTRDRDLVDDTPYPDIKINQWQQVGNAKVYYMSPRLGTIKDVLSLIVNTPHDVLYLNSFFDLFTVKALLIRKFTRVKFRPVIVAPRGEFAWGSLRLKYFKKLVYIQAARLFGLCKKVVWQAASEIEAHDIAKIMKIKPDAIRVALDLPNKIIADEPCSAAFQSLPDQKGLRLVFLSRVAREKNLDYALKVLSKVNKQVVFDIYGPTEDAAYWKECQALIKRLPTNVAVNYLGSVKPDKVMHTFSQYDLFLFPTAGESYGHVIAECLTSGTPVLISTATSWCNLQDDGLGWDVDLSHMDSFVEIIEKFALLSDNERLEKRVAIKAKIAERLLDPSALEANRQLFKAQMSN